MPRNQQLFDELLAHLSSNPLNWHKILEDYQNFGVDDGQREGPYIEPNLSEIVEEIAVGEDQSLDPSDPTDSPNPEIDEITNIDIADDTPLSEEEIAQAYELLRVTLRLDERHDLSDEDVQLIADALNSNPILREKVLWVLFTADLDHFPLKNMPNLKRLEFSSNWAVSNITHPCVAIQLDDLSTFPELRELYLCDRYLLGGWPDLMRNDKLEKLVLENSPMQYPPHTLPQSLKSLSIAGSALITIPNLSLGALPNFTEIYGADSAQLTQVSRIALASCMALRRGVQVNIPSLSVELLDEHFASLLQALQTAGVVDTQSYLDFNLLALQEMIEEGPDQGSKQVLQNYSLQVTQPAARARLAAV